MTKFFSFSVVFWASFLLFLSNQTSQSVELTSPILTSDTKFEFRGAWIATVINLDWPNSRNDSPAEQQKQLATIIHQLHLAGINAVFFQVRSEADAMYDSSIEPWSYYLTGTQGTPPDPYWDPLSFAIEEAHKRGMELHAWLNPYRANRNLSGGYARHSQHVSMTHPDWMLEVGNIQIINPGIPEAQQYIVDIVKDIVQRYNVDGIHFDDYFYPYEGIGTQDLATYQTYADQNVSMADWRRANVNHLVQGVYEGIQQVNPEVKFGISPFGIWKSGIPSGTSGLSAYNDIYADAVAWLENEWIDYINPQLYWAFGGNQDYAKLAPWWATQAKNRHIYTGHGLYRADATTFSGTLFDADEIPNQVRFNRTYSAENANKIQGSVFFRAKNITHYSSKGFRDSLKTNLYPNKALTPSMNWKDLFAPPSPSNFSLSLSNNDKTVNLTWDTPFPSFGEPDAKRFVIYRVEATNKPLFSEVAPHAENIIGITSNLSFTDSPATTGNYHYFISSVSANSIESSEASLSVMVSVGNEEEQLPSNFSLGQNYPNPFNSQTTIPFTLEKDGIVSLTVYNLLGQKVDVLIEDKAYSMGEHFFIWNRSQTPTLTQGVYLYILTVDGKRASKKIIVRD